MKRDGEEERKRALEGQGDFRHEHARAIRMAGLVWGIEHEQVQRLVDRVLWKGDKAWDELMTQAGARRG